MYKMSNLVESSDNLTPFNGSYHMKRELIGHQKGVRSACNISDEYVSLLSTDGIDCSILSDVEYLVTGGIEGEVIVWKFNRNGDCDLITRFMAHVNNVMCICPSKLLNDYIDMSFFNDKNNADFTIMESKLCIYTCGRDKLIHRFNLIGKKLLTLEGHDDVVCSLHEPKDSSKLISGSWDGTAIVWNILTGTKDFVLPCTGYQYSVYVNTLPNDYIITAMQNGDLCLWNRTKLVKFDKVHKDVVRAISIKNNEIATCSNDNTVKIFNLDLNNILTINAHDSFIYDVRYSRYYDVLYSSSEDKSVRIWDGKNGSLLQMISLESSVWQVIELSYNGIVTVELNGNLILWQLQFGISKPIKDITVDVYNEKMYDMILYKKFNNIKALELLQKYNTEVESKDKLNDREMIYLEQVINKELSHVTLSSIDVEWIQKLLKWPMEFRLPIFDLLKVLASYCNTEPLFKGRNNGSNVIISICSTLLTTDNIPLITVSLQTLSNLLFPSLSKALLYCHYERIFKSVTRVSSLENRMIQNALSILCQNFIISLLDCKDYKLILEGIIDCMSLSLNTCININVNDWIQQVINKHIQTLDILLSSKLSCTDVLIAKNIKQIVNDIINKLELDCKYSIQLKNFLNN